MIFVHKMDLAAPLTYDPLANEAVICLYLESTVTGYVYISTSGTVC